jgi:hypothetical protein
VGVWIESDTWAIYVPVLAKRSFPFVKHHLNEDNERDIQKSLLLL